MPEDIEITKENVFEVDIEKLALDDRFGDLKFTDTSSQLLQIQEWLKEVHDLNYKELLEQDNVEKIDRYTNAFVILLRMLQKFDFSTVSNPKAEQVSFNQRVADFHIKLLVDVENDILPLLKGERKRDDPEQQRLDAEFMRVSGIKSRAKEKAEEAEIKKLEKQREELRAKQQKAEEVYAGLSKRAQRQSGGYFRDHFTRQAEKHNERAWNSIWLVYLFVGIIIIIGACFLIWYKPNFEIQENIGFWGSFFAFLIESKLFFLSLIISMLIYAVRFFSRIFSAEKNLENIYIQKQKALDAHQQILDAVQDTKSENHLETQNAILTYMSQSIFEVHSSGYLNKDKDNRTSNSRISPLDITRMGDEK